MRRPSVRSVRPRGDARALGLFGLLAIAFFWQLWAPRVSDRMMIGAADGDFMRQFYPYRAFVARAWASGHAPLWNPHQYAGAPAWADPQLAVVYPWRALQAAMVPGGRELPVWAVELEAVAHVALAGWFTWLLLRRLGAGRAGAFVAGAVYAFGGYLSGYPVEQLAVLDTAAWIPAVLWALAGAFDAAATRARARAVRWTTVAAGATALMALAGHPQTAMYGLALALVWCGWRIWRAVPPRQDLALVAPGWLALSAGLAAAQWLPSLALLHRVAPRFESADLTSGLAWRDLLQIVAPGVLTRWSPVFVGSGVLVLVVWAAVRVPVARFWILSAGVAGLVALGGRTPLLALALRFVPGMALFRHHERAAVVFSLAMAVAAGLAVDRILAAGRSERGVVARGCAAAGALAALGALVGTVRPGSLERVLGIADPAAWQVAPADALAVSALALGATAAILGIAARGASPARVGAALGVAIVFELFAVDQARALSRQVHVFRPDALTQALVARARDGRVASEALLPGGANAASVFGLYDVTGDAPLRLRSYDALEANAPEIVRWRLLGVRYVVSDRTFPPGAPVARLLSEGDRGLYETELAVPPAWVPARAELVAAGTDWPFAPPPDYDPLARAPFQAELPRLDGDLRPGAGADDLLTEAAIGQWRTRGDARLVGLDPGRIVVEATLDREGVVIAATSYDRGWRAVATQIGGDAATVVRPAVRAAYGALVAVALPAGRWRVEWTYLPGEVSIGVAVSAVTLALVGMAWRWAAGRPT